MKIGPGLESRRGISPVLAEVILIAITLIAGVAIAGFAFGLFGAYTSTPRVSVNSDSCSDITNAISCTLQVGNSGNGNGAIEGASIKYADSKLGANTITSASVSGSCSNFPCTINAGAPVVLTLTFTENNGHGTAVSGTSFTGFIDMSNGAVVEFSGSF